MVSQASWLLFLGLVGFTFMTESSKVRDAVLQQESYVDQCTPVPTWSIHGQRVVNLVGENITVIALLNSSRVFGRQQAEMFNLLQNRLNQAGFTSINFMVVDSMWTTEKNQLLRMELPNIPVYKEQPKQPVQDFLGAGNDQVLVLDKCGRVAYQVITPFSKLTHPYVKAAILSTYTDNPCGMCNQTGKVNYFLYGWNDTSINHASVARDMDSEKSLNSSTRETLKIHSMSQVVHTSRKNEIETQNRSGQSQHVGSVKLIWRSNSSDPELAQDGLANTTTAPMKITSSPSEKITVTSQVAQRGKASGRAPLLENYRSHIEAARRNTDFQVKSQEIPSRNWDWSQSRSQHHVNEGTSDERNEQSVEVVHEVWKSSERNSNAQTEAIKNALLDVIEPDGHSSSNIIVKDHKAVLADSLAQEPSGDSDSREITQNSMEELMNQTQKLFDWYQKQIENGTSSEEEYERSNILKFKIIEHYSRLLPWLNYKLTPKVKH